MNVRTIKNGEWTASHDLPVQTRQAERPSDHELQRYLLNGVSRTFALTIPQLPVELAWSVANAYLLCRIVDTIEDEPALTPGRKRQLCEVFIEVVAGKRDARSFALQLAPRLTAATSTAERELVELTPDVIRITRHLSQRQQDALLDCVNLMARGMALFQETKDACGLRDITQLNNYCYYVAGVVGEMLTRLFCDYSAAIAVNHDAMMRLSVSFGQGLQMTNILKDIWDDRSRGDCWLPKDVFAGVGFDLEDLASGRNRRRFGRGLVRLVSIAHRHLDNALAYTLLIPKQETGIRNFCLWNIGMAVLTLRKIHKHPEFSATDQVKISRSSVKATILLSRLTAAHDQMLKSLFYLTGIGLSGEHGQPGSVF